MLTGRKEPLAVQSRSPAAAVFTRTPLDRATVADESLWFQIYRPEQRESLKIACNLFTLFPSTIFPSIIHSETKMAATACRVRTLCSEKKNLLFIVFPLSLLQQTHSKHTNTQAHTLDIHRLQYFQVCRSNEKVHDKKKSGIFCIFRQILCPTGWYLGKCQLQLIQTREKKRNCRKYLWE